jgi:hypothetical protein
MGELAGKKSTVVDNKNRNKEFNLKSIGKTYYLNYANKI